MLSNKDKRTKNNKKIKKRNNRKYTKLKGGSVKAAVSSPQIPPPLDDEELNKEYSYIATLGITDKSGKNDKTFNKPSDVAISSDGKLIYIADTYNGRIQVFDGSKYNYKYMIDKGNYNKPRSVAVSTKLNQVYVADTNNRVVKIYQDRISGKKPIYTLGNKLLKPWGVAFSEANNCIYIADSDNNCVQVYNGNTYEHIATLGEAGNSGNNNNKFKYPAKVAISTSDKRIYVADPLNHRIQVFNGNTTEYNFIGTLGKTGQDGNDYDHFKFPYGVSVSPFDNLVYVADTYNHRIQVFDGTTLKYISTLGSYGKNNTQFHYPYSVTVSPFDNRIYVADTDNHRIQIFEKKIKPSTESNIPPNQNYLPLNAPTNSSETNSSLS